MNCPRFTAGLVALGLLCSPAAFAERPLVAVLDFQEVQSGLAPHEVELLADISRGEALDHLGGGYNIITRENLLDLLKAHGTDLAQCQGACETETGRLIGADYVLSGSIVKAFGAFKVNLKLHRTQPPELLGAEVMTAQSQGEIETEVRAATSAVLSALSGVRQPSEGSGRSPDDSSDLRKGASALGSVTSALMGAVSLGKSLHRDPLGVAQALTVREDTPDETRVVEEDPGRSDADETDSGVHMLVDLGGLLFFGPVVSVEVGGKRRFKAWYRHIPLGLLVNSEPFIGSGESYDSAWGVGVGMRWYGNGQSGLDGLWYGLGAEYIYSDLYFEDFSVGESGRGNYITKAVIAEGLIGYRWGSDGWANQVGAGLGLAFEVEFIQPMDGVEEFQQVYPVVVYEIEFF
jgi:hypothetical protein